MELKPFLKSYNDLFIITDCIKSTDLTNYSTILFDLNKCYISNNSLSISFFIFVLFAIYSFLWSVIGNNCSKVDQIWSVTPIVYAIHFFYHNYITSNTGILHERGLVVVILIALWGVRLTFNFWRRGGYGNLISHEEDYRWPILRKKMNMLTFLLFNLTFIATYQNLLLWLITLPVYVVISGSPYLNEYHYMIAGLFLLLLVGETIADQQQYDYQNWKYTLTLSQRSKSPIKSIRDGFLQYGLFAYCRHPNYFCEQMIWVCVYLFSLTSNINNITTNLFTIQNDIIVNIDGLIDYIFGTSYNIPQIVLLKEYFYYINTSIIGLLLLIMLFQGSMSFSESITSSKYPLYKEYQKSTPQCIPWFPAKNKNKII